MEIVLINFTFINNKRSFFITCNHLSIDTAPLFICIALVFSFVYAELFYHPWEFLIYASYSSVFGQQWVTTLSLGLSLAIFCSFRQFKTLRQLQNLWKLKCADIYSKFFVLYLVTMQPCLTLQSLQMLFNQPMCTNHDVCSPHVVLFAWCLLACCESDSMSRGPLTTIMTGVA